MYTIENVVREIKGEKKEVRVLFGTGLLSNNPPEVQEVGQNGAKVLRGNKDHPFALAFPDPSLGKDEHGRTKLKFFNVEAWAKNADNLHQLGYKWQPIEVVARVEKQTYNGNEYEMLVIERFEVKKYKPRDGEASGASNTGQPDSGQSGADQSGESGGDSDPFTVGRPINISDDDIPF
ncbi:Single-stranded DNA-binding protein [Brevibacillus sp. NPDC058079]|uniref:Single-stranded DNA-binding protein n=1 Tax=Brevibacillus sp. NPDC058079 TaxID=3346330 RepID=UPI0036EAE133